MEYYYLVITCDHKPVFQMPLQRLFRHFCVDLGLKTASQYLSSTVLSATEQKTSLVWKPVRLAIHLALGQGIQA